MSSRWSWLLRRSPWVLSALLVLTTVFIWHLRRLQFDSSPSTLIISGSAEKHYHERISRVFGSDQILLIAISSDDLLEPGGLQQMRDLTSRLERIPGIKRVLSLTNVSDVKGEKDEVTISPLVPEDLQNLDGESLRARILANPLLEGSLVSKDLRTTCLIAFLDDFDPRSALVLGRDVTRQVRTAVDRMRGKQHVIIGGLPEMELEGTENMIRDLWLFTPLTLLLVLGILMLTFRSFRGILLPLVIIALTLSWSVGIMAWTGVSLKVSTLVLPSLLISNGCSYVIHFLAQYRRILAGNYLPPAEQSETGRVRHKNAILDTLKLTQTPIFISALTTMAGFGSLALNRIPAIRDLGIFAILGIFLSSVFCLTITPSILALLPEPRDSKPQPDRGRALDAFLARVAAFVSLRRRWIFGASILAAACAVAGASRLEVRTDYLGYFGKNAPVVRAAEEFHERLAGIAPVSVILEAGGTRPITDPRILQAAESFQQSLRAISGIDSTFSLVDTLKLLNRAFHSEDPRFFSLPEEAEAVRQLIELAESDPRGLVPDLLAEDEKSLRILVRTHLFDSSSLQQLLSSVEREGTRLLPPEVRARVTGTLVLMNRTSDQVAVEQVKSLLVSVALIALIVLLVFRSWRIGLQALGPAALPILLFFGLMGWAGIPLNANTSVIASIAIGIAIDNCIHYIVHFQRSTRSGLSIRDSTRQSLERVGGPMISAAGALTLGFIVFGFSNFAPVSHFGFLSAFIMVVNLMADLFLLPALMAVTRDGEG